MSKLILPKEPVELKPCPFCGSRLVDPKGWVSSFGSFGPACDNCGGSASSAERWNLRRHQPDEEKGFCLSRQEYEHLQDMFLHINSQVRLPHRFEEEVKKLRDMITARTGICYAEYT